MPPKKRDKDTDTTKSSKVDHVQADHELFLQAFEKPTQIYRFLRTRNMLSPIFLNRTLSYMKKRMSRSNKSRIGFKIDSLLNKVTQRRNSELQTNSLGGYMTLTFLGFHDKSLESYTPKDFQIKAETLLLKICHKKRKESSSAIIEVSVGSCSVPLNPDSSEPPTMASAVSISSDTFSPSQGPNVKSYMLMLRVTVSPVPPPAHNGTHSTAEELANGDAEEPAQKRLKSSSIDQLVNTQPPNDSSNKNVKLYGSELIVYDKHNRCLLLNGEYELVMHDVPQPQPKPSSGSLTKSPHKSLMPQWESIPEDISVQSETNPFDVFQVRPVLKVKLSWSHEPTNGLVNRPKLYQQDAGPEITASNKENNRPVNASKMQKTSQNGNAGSSNAAEKGGEDTNETAKRPQIIYQFLYNNNSRQQTEACEDLHCPWCSLDCGALYPLLKHLKLCHERFNFTYFPIPGGARIDVSINDHYDGSYVGSPHDLIASQGRARGSGGARAGPVRRTALTHLLVCRPRYRHRPPRTPKQCLSEFLELEDNEVLESQRPYITGHSRLYHHTITCLPVYPKELDIDSEGETDPLWLQQKTMMMIDEFTDVNEGEKELMKMWNLHVMKYNFVGDCQIPLACQMFLQTRSKELLEKNLYRNFVLHMCSLHDFGLLSAVALYQTLQLLNQILAENNEAKEAMRESLKVQREQWKKVGMHLQPNILEPKSLSAQNKGTNFSLDASPSVRRKMTTLQNVNRMGSSSFANQASVSAEGSKKKKVNLPTPISATGENPHRRKSAQNTISSIQSKCGDQEIPARRKSSSTTSSAVAANAKRSLPLQRKSSA